MTNDERLKRLKEIRREICEGEGNYTTLTEALPKVQGWLDRRGTDVGVALQATQILLADGGRRSSANAAAEKSLDEVLAEYDSVGLQLQKCLVLACWEPDVATKDVRRVLALAASSWWWTDRTKDAAWKWIGPLLKAFNEPPERSFFPALQAYVAPSFDKAGIDQRLAKVLTSIASDVSQAGTLAPPLVEVTNAIQASFSFGHRLAAQLETELPAQIRDYLGAFAEENVLLWWSSARYCRRHERPLRALSTDAMKRWWAAYELAQVVSPSLVEPACSMLVETLVDLGVPFDTSRPLRAWLAELHDLLRDDEKVPALIPSFSAQIERCAVGLPVSCLRLDRTSSFDAALLTKATTLDLDTNVTSWQWSSWLLRESMLERAFR